MDITVLEQALKLQRDLADRLAQGTELARTGKLAAIEVLVKQKEEMLAHAKAEVDTAANQRDVVMRRWDERVTQCKAVVTQLEGELSDLKSRLAEQHRASPSKESERTPKKPRGKKGGNPARRARDSAAAPEPAPVDAVQFVATQQIGDVADGQRRAVQVTLYRDAVTAHEIQLLAGLHALGDDVELQGLGHRDDRLDDGGVVGVGGHVADEGAVDLQGVDGQAYQITLRGIPGPEIVVGELHARNADFLLGLQQLRLVRHQQTLGDFESDPLTAETDLLHEVHHDLLEADAVELPAGKIYRNPNG